ncbi:MAG TPA: hypothetical protein VJ372_05830 [Pyrinomonadaceae bacterium]|nr:hypothetical protein [Pyrinomonadaceae bacterium]
MRRLLPMFCLVALLFLLSSLVTAQQKLTYIVQYSSEHSGRIHVQIAPASPINSPVTLVMPRAIPSGYAQQFYDRYVDQVKATTSSETPPKKQDGPRWRVEQPGLTKIEYEVDVARLEQEIFDASAASKVRPEYVGLLGYSVLGYLEGFENLPVHLEVDAPQGWPVFTTLTPKVPCDTTKTLTEARNFYELADSQIAMGPKLELRRLPTPVPLFLAIYSEVPTDIKKHGEIFADAFMKVLAYFSIGPFDHYTAYIEILKPLSERHDYGFSMEHLTSSTYFLGVTRAIDANTSPQQLELERFNFAHHVTHSWIPKHVYGTGYMPFLWELAPQIDTIWFNEGFARYVAIEALADALPVAEAKKFRQQRLDSYRKLIDSMPGFIRSMSLVELSRVGSSMYSEDFRIGQTLFCKGALMAAAMDDSIRKQTQGRNRLRDSLRALVSWSEHSGRAFRIAELPGLIARPVGVNEQSIRTIMNEWLKGS